MNIYIFLPESTDCFSDKEKIKKAGFKFNGKYGWFIIKEFNNDDELIEYNFNLSNKAKEQGLNGAIVFNLEDVINLKTPNQFQKLITRNITN